MVALAGAGVHRYRLPPTKGSTMVMGFAILLVCQLAGEVVSRGFGLPVPGPVLGLVLLVMGLVVWGRGRDDAAIASSAVARVSNGLLAHLALLFVPAGVGVVEYGGLLKAEALPLAAALLGSTAITLVVTVLVFVGVARLLRRSSGSVASDEGAAS